MNQLGPMLLSAFKLHPYKLGFFLSIGQTFAIILSSRSQSQWFSSMGQWLASPAALFGMLLSLVSLLLVTKMKMARKLVWASLAIFGCLALFHLKQEPLKGYLVLCLLYLCTIFLRDIEVAYRKKAADFRKQLLAVLFGFSFLNWSFVHIFQFSIQPVAHIAVISTGLIVFGLLSIDAYFTRTSRWLLALGLAISILFFLAPLFRGGNHHLAEYSQRSFALTLSGIWGLGIRYSLRQKLSAAIESLFFHPEGAVALLFALFCAFGAILLVSPLSAGGGVRIRVLDALFTSISAVCVTGLNTLDFVKDFSIVGQVIVLILIQVGGLGIMTLSSLAVFVMGEKISFQQENAIAKIAGSKIKDKVQSTLASVMIFTFVVEFIGAMVLAFEYWNIGVPMRQAIWKGIFTAISAFCNAGFSLDSDSLIGISGNYLILHTIGVLIILGGLSPAVVLAIPTIFRGERLTVQTRLTLVVSLVLQLLGFVFFAISEWTHSLGNLDIMAKFHNAWFQSVTARTAGFNSIDMTLITDTTAFMMIILMFVGGSPGGTAGGIKTTTLAIMFGAVTSVLKGGREVSFYFRKVPSETVMRAMGVFFVSLLIGLGSSMILIATQNLKGMDLTFEVFSALGTVGLSRGITPELDSIGKIVIMLCMFLGRIGPLSIFIFIFEQKKKKSLSYPSEDIVVT